MSGSGSPHTFIGAHAGSACACRARGAGLAMSSRMTQARSKRARDDRCTGSATEGVAMSELPNVVLVHGAWADGSSWSAVIRALQAKGYNVTAPQLPETSLADDVARVRHVLTRQSGPTIVPRHSSAAQAMTPLPPDAPTLTP